MSFMKQLGPSTNSRQTSYPNGWRTGPTEEWYDEQEHKSFEYLEYRRERKGLAFHDFIVVQLGNDLICRFERQDDSKITKMANPHNSAPQDTAVTIHKSQEEYAKMINTSDLLIRIRFPRGHDLLTILGVCYCVQKEDETRAENLEKYNPGLLPWAIAAIVTRRTADWSLLARDSDAWEEMVPTAIERTNNEAIERMNKEPQRIGRFFGPMAKK
ncbi:RNA-directed RNA polymerase L [Ceratobasidium sp. AG-Ba]|nr:RNA-directed RNA polymerase L [Ceratobasidium sp. AG-Ba]QRW06923.1 RNA-directed RNA polymerase L [Ceratobasidium sp. AG-Ba]